MAVKDFLNSEDSIFFSPRICTKESNYEMWLFPHMNINGVIYNNLVHIVYEKNGVVIVVFSEDKEIESNVSHITKISNLVHDTCDIFKVKCVVVNDIYDVNLNVTKIITD